MSSVSPPPVRRPEGRDALRVAILLWILVAGIFALAVRNAPVDATRVAVFVTYEGEPRRQFLQEATAEVLSAALDGVGSLRSVAPRALALAGGEVAESPSEDEARALAARFSASHFVLGSVVLEGDALTLSATLHETEGSRSRLVTAAGDIDEFAALADEVAIALAGRAFGTGGALPEPSGKLYSASLPALEAFFRAERSRRAGRYAQAGSLYERALGEDPTFALAHQRMALTAGLMDRYAMARQASQRALDLSTSVSPRHRLLVQAQNAWITGRAAEAERILAELVSLYPDDPDAWDRLSELQFHGAPFRAHPPGVALQATGEALRLDPANVDALERAGHIALASGDLERLDALVDQAGVLDPSSSLALVLLTVQEALRGEISAPTLARLRAGDASAARDATRALASSARDMDAALLTAALLTEVGRPPGVRALAEVWTAFLHLARGRRAPAEEAFARAAELDPDLAAEHRALAYTLPFLRYATATTRQLAARMERWRPGGARTNAEPEPHYQMHLQSRPVFAPYLAGRLSLAAGDTVAARLWEIEVRAAPWGPDDPPLPAALAAGLAAEIERLEEGSEGTLESLQSAYDGMSYQLRQPSMLLSLARERWLMAELLEERGATQEAARWFEPYWGRVGESVFVAPSYYRRARLRDAAGDAEGARGDYEHFLELWSNADEGLRAWVDDAAVRLAALPGG